MRLEEASKDQPIDFVGVLRGYVGFVVGVQDWDVSRMGEATEIVVYRFGDRHRAQLACRALKGARDLAYGDIDDCYAPDSEIVLGDGSGALIAGRRAMRIRVRSGTGFALDPVAAFERIVEIVEGRRWDETLPVRAIPRRGKGEARASARGGGEDAPAGRLGAAQRMDAKVGHRSAPDFSQTVKGFFRKIGAGRMGLDRDGNRTVPGETWITGHTRYGKKPAKPEGWDRRRRRAPAEEPVDDLPFALAP